MGSARNLGVEVLSDEDRGCSRKTKKTKPCPESSVKNAFRGHLRLRLGGNVLRQGFIISCSNL